MIKPDVTALTRSQLDRLRCFLVSHDVIAALPFLKHLDRIASSSASPVDWFVLNSPSDLKGVMARLHHGHVAIHTLAPAAAEQIMEQASWATFTSPAKGLIGAAPVIDACLATSMLRDQSIARHEREQAFAISLQAHCERAGSGALLREACLGDVRGLCSNTLTTWLSDFAHETGHTGPDPALNANVGEMAKVLVASKDTFVLWHREQPVSMCRFCDFRHGLAHVGGVWTPPEHRGRGHATTLLRQALQVAYQRGARQACLRTGSAEAARLYQRIGFERVDDFCVVTWRHPYAPIN
ncbi:GNAT family N-acetyltransferase [Tateyamaria sp. syn59]|uniref:GNAT family N-acetyltransferase n=1 Tax=Tateyamaria sp. syn59 TaxID=2576942 RepID=UPI0016786BCE|nr:GNAT family N-acetyltransferase [Tateyamaria sp. syn59]